MIFCLFHCLRDCLCIYFYLCCFDEKLLSWFPESVTIQWRRHFCFEQKTRENTTRGRGGKRDKSCESHFFIVMKKYDDNTHHDNDEDNDDDDDEEEEEYEDDADGGWWEWWWGCWLEWEWFTTWWTQWLTTFEIVSHPYNLRMKLQFWGWGCKFRLKSSLTIT